MEQHNKTATEKSRLGGQSLLTRVRVCAGGGDGTAHSDSDRGEQAACCRKEQETGKIISDAEGKGQALEVLLEKCGSRT